MNSWIVAVAVVLVADVGLAQTPTACVPTIASLQQIVADTMKRDSSEKAVMTALDRAIGAEAATPYIMAGMRDGLGIVVQGPARAYRFHVSEAFRRRDPIDKVTAPSVVTVIVEPTTIDAPSIIKVLIERDGKLVDPLTNTLQPKEMVTRIGAKAVINAGSLTFPCSAFDQGGKVVLTAIPNSGRNIVRTFTIDEIGQISGRVVPGPPRVSSLIGRSVASVKALLGEPDTLASTRVGYNTPSGERVYIDFNSNSRVISVSAPNVLISTIAKKPR